MRPFWSTSAPRSRQSRTCVKGPPRKQPFDHAWVMDSAGTPTRDPSVVERATDRGSLILLGGQEAGHKGFGLALMVEALTQGLAGFGRKDAPTRWGASVYMQLIDPDGFAG